MRTSARSRYAGYRFPAEIIGHAVWLYFRFPLGLGMVEELLAARGIIVSHENRTAVGAQIWPAIRQSDPSPPAAGGRQMASRWCVTNTFLKEEMWSCTRDEGG